MDSLFLRQVWAGNDALLQQLARDVVTRAVGPERTAAEARLHYFLINKGPWSRLDHNKRVRARRAGQARGRQLLSCRRDEGRGPEMARLALSGDAKAAATGFFTTIRRGPEGFTAVPYSSSTRGSWREAAALLREAANADDRSRRSRSS